MRFHIEKSGTERKFNGRTISDALCGTRSDRAVIYKPETHTINRWRNDITCKKCLTIETKQREQTMKPDPLTKAEKLNRLTEAKDLIMQAIELIHEVDQSKNTAAYLTDQLRIHVDSDHEFLSSDLTIQKLMDRITD